MKAIRNTRELMTEARQLEEASRLTEAAAAYQDLVDADATNQQAVSRLLTVYRRLKEPRKELAVIESVLGAYALKDKSAQDKWLSTHPQAARAGQAFLRSLGGETVSGFGTNPMVGRLLKRKEVVEKKLHGKKAGAGKAKGRKNKGAVALKVVGGGKAEAARRAEERRLAAEQKKLAAKEQRAEAKRKAEAARKLKAEEKSARLAEKKAAAAAKKEAAAAQKTAAAAARKAAVEVKLPTLFVITLRYLVSLEKIDAMMPQHGAFLDKHFAKGDFLVAGRQVPRTGGIIIARGKDRAAIERIMKQDPFLQRKLASVDIVEFSASKLNKQQWQQLK